LKAACTVTGMEGRTSAIRHLRKFNMGKKYEVGQYCGKHSNAALQWVDKLHAPKNNRKRYYEYSECVREEKKKVK
jgi:hypothetical protein